MAIIKSGARIVHREAEKHGVVFYPLSRFLPSFLILLSFHVSFFPHISKKCLFLLCSTLSVGTHSGVLCLSTYVCMVMVTLSGEAAVRVTVNQFCDLDIQEYKR